MPAVRIEVFKAASSGPKKKWYWRLREEHSGKIVAVGGESYYSKWNAKRAALKRHPASAFLFLHSEVEG